MPINFPSSPTLNEVYTWLNKSWQWNGTAWLQVRTGAALVRNETPAGLKDGVNTTFTTASPFVTGSLGVYLNGQRLKVTDDYTVDDAAHTFTLLTAPLSTDALTVDYDTNTGELIIGSNSWVVNDTPWIGTANGNNTAFIFHHPYVPGSMQLYRDGQLMQGGGNDYYESDPNAGVVQFVDGPAADSVILATYQKVVSTSGNADTLDGYHATSFVRTSDQASGIAVLSSAFVVTGASQVYQDTGLALNLPVTGTYAIDGSIRGVVANNMPNCQLYVKLYNATAGADIADTETLVIYSQTANVIVQNTISLTALVTVTGPTTIKLYAARSMEAGSTWSFSQLDANWAGKTRMRFIKVG